MEFEERRFDAFGSQEVQGVAFHSIAAERKKTGEWEAENGKK